MKSENEHNLPSPINVGGHIYLSVVYTIFSESTDLTIHSSKSSSSSMRVVATSDIAHGTADGLTG
jgi:hypothetical protein